jgi:uncharacterized membrane protein
VGDLVAPDNSPVLPSHVEETVREIAKLHAEHHRGATPMQQLVDRSVRTISRPRFVGTLTAIIVAWMVLNVGSAKLGYPLDPPPFQFLQDIGGALAISSEKKNAKIIQLLEELRRDSPMVSNRIDPEADALAVPADTHMVVEALRDSDEDPLGEPPPASEE